MTDPTETRLPRWATLVGAVAKHPPVCLAAASSFLRPTNKIAVRDRLTTLTLELSTETTSSQRSHRTMRPDVFLAAMRRAILDTLDDDTSIAAATASVADDWAARRRARGESPSSIAAANVLVLQAGAELAAELHVNPALAMEVAA